jgi:hypothetical protein
MQTAGSSGVSDIAELANWPNYSHLPPPVNIVMIFLNRYCRYGYRVNVRLELCGNHCRGHNSTPKTLHIEQGAWLWRHRVQRSAIPGMKAWETDHEGAVGRTILSARCVVCCPADTNVCPTVARHAGCALAGQNGDFGWRLVRPLPTNNKRLVLQIETHGVIGAPERDPRNTLTRFCNQ